jgi:predicted metal-dependent hydrolase
MAQIIQLGRPPIEVTVKRSARARRLSLRVSGMDGKVSLTLPRSASSREANAFLQDKEEWIRTHLEAKQPLVDVSLGASVPVEGALRQVVASSNRTVRLHPGRIDVPAGADHAGARVRAFLKTLARDRLADASAQYAERLGREFGRITLRDTRSRWGSCTSEGNLMYSWRLIMAPTEVLDYVAAHEVAHLVEMNHSPAFWSTVAELMPDYQARRSWLRAEGAALHRYRFA